ncbi:MAG: hypothetical protein MRQ13_01340 [Candidatus Midichloria sp.]|nr:hypothetical protein [Candidatus Midichloria sp.]
MVWYTDNRSIDARIAKRITEKVRKTDWTAKYFHDRILEALYTRKIG